MTSPLRQLERALMISGLACLGAYGWHTADARFSQRAIAAAFEMTADPQSPRKAPAAHAPLGMLEIPRLGVSTPIMAGDDEKTLSKAVGHLPDTPLPWEQGNAAVAAHRDGLFRPLENIRIGDVLHLRTAHGALRYEVRRTKIVQPDDLSVLEPTARPTLTLITCYPFRFVGNAPQRFIVQAERR